MPSDALVDGLLDCLNGVGAPMCVYLRAHRSRTCCIVEGELLGLQNRGLKLKKVIKVSKYTYRT